MRRLPAPPNARVDGIDARSAGLAAFVVSQVEAPSAGTQTSARAVEILLASRARETRRRRTVGAGVALGALTAAGLAVGMAVIHLPPTLSYTVDGAAPLPSGYVRASAGHEQDLAFSDGTNIHVLPSTSARVLDVGRHGARFMLEDGRAHVQVAHRPGADWQVQAGAYLIHVHGTAFFVEWNAPQSRLDLQMESGVVSVDGPRAGDTVILRGGQSLSVWLDGSRVVATTHPTLAARASTLTGSETVPVSPALEAPPPPASTASVDTPRYAPNAAPPRALWSERLADGEAAGIVAEAQRRGVARVLAGASRGPGGPRGCCALPQPGPPGSTCAARPAPSVPGDVAGRGGVVPVGAARRRPGRSRSGRARLVRPLPARSAFRSLCRRGDGADDARARAPAADWRGAHRRGGVPPPVP